MTTLDLDAPIVTVKVKAGDRWVIPLWYKIAGTGVDVSGLTLRAHLANEAGDKLFEFTPDLTVGEPTDGQFGIVALSALTTGRRGTYYSDVEIVTDGEPTTIVSLVIQVSPEHTR